MFVNSAAILLVAPRGKRYAVCEPTDAKRVSIAAVLPASVPA